MISDAFFVLEGPDSSGKSTLCADLQKAYNIPYIHLTHYKDKERHQRQFDKIELLLDLYLAGKMSTGIIFDRFIFSTQVYEEVFHNGSTIANFNAIYEKLNAVARKCPFGVNVIFTLPRPRERYLQAFNTLKEAREEMFTDTALMGEIYDEFSSMAKALRIANPDFKVCEFDYFKELDKGASDHQLITNFMEDNG